MSQTAVHRLGPQIDDGADRVLAPHGLLQDLNDRLGMSYLHVSHDLHVRQVLCDRIIVMRTGWFVEHGLT